MSTDVRAMSLTEKRVWLMDRGWTRGRNQADWRHPEHPGSHTAAGAVRIASGGSK